MAIEWSGLSPELLVRLDRSSGQPLRAQLEAGLRDAIRSGRLRGGERLPSSRELARELGVSRGIVQECFGQLLAEGYLTSRTGSATRVGRDRGRARAARPACGRRRAPAGAPRARPRLIADFAYGVPDLSSFPRADWGWAVREACGAVASADLGYGDPRGSARAARGAGRVPAAGARRRRRPGADDHQHRLRAGAQPGAAGAGEPRPASARWRSRIPATAAPRPTRRCARRRRWACGVCYVPVDERGPGRQRAGR